MAILPVNQMIQQPNIAGALQQGVQFGQQQKAYQRELQDQNALRTLAPQVIGNQPGAFEQAAAINPQAAGQYQQAGDGQLRRMKGFVKYVDDARASGNMQAVNAALQQGSGFIGQILGKPGPTEWTPDMEPGWEALKSQIAMAEGGSQGRVQSTYVDDQGQRVAIMADGSQKVLGGNDAGATQQTITINGPDGRPAQYTFDRRTGNYVPAGQSMGGQQAPAAAPTVGQGQGQQLMDQIAASANQMIARGIPAEQVDQWAQSQMGGGTMSQGLPSGGNQLQTTQAVVNGPSPFVGRRPEDEADAVTRARQRAELEYLPQRQEIETRGAIDRTVGTERAKADIAKESGQGKARLSLDQATARLGRVDELVASILPRINIGTAGWAGSALSNVPGTSAADLRKDIGTLQAIAGFDELNAMRAASPTGGALGNVTERELAFLQSVVRNIENSQSPAQLERNLRSFQQELRGSWQRVNDAYQQDYGQGGQQGNSRQPPQPGAVQDGYRFRGGNPADPNSWERI